MLGLVGEGGLEAVDTFADYSVAKAGLLSLTRTLAYEFAPHSIRVNAICPTAVDTDMIHNDRLYRMLRPDLDEPGRADVAPFDDRARHREAVNDVIEQLTGAQEERASILVESSSPSDRRPHR